MTQADTFADTLMGTLPEGLHASDIQANLRGTHADPFAVLGQHDGQVRVFAPHTASVIHGLPEHDWQDAAW